MKGLKEIEVEKETIKVMIKETEMRKPDMQEIEVGIEMKEGEGKEVIEMMTKEKIEGKEWKGKINLVGEGIEVEKVQEVEVKRRKILGLVRKSQIKRSAMIQQFKRNF